MAITIITSPQRVRPIYNEIFYELESDRVTELDYQFKVIISVVKNNVSNIIATLYVSPDENDKGIFDISKIIQSQLHIPFKFNGDNPFTSDDFHVQYGITYQDYFRPSVNFISMVEMPSGNTGYATSAISVEFSPGDFIKVSQDTPFTDPYYNGKAEVVQLHHVPGPPSLTIIETTKPFLDSATIFNTGKLTLFSNKKKAIGMLPQPVRFYAVNSALDWTQYVQYSFVNHSFRFLTNLNKISMYKDSNCVLNVWNDSNNYGDKEIKLFINGIHNYTFDFSNNNVYEENKMLCVPVGPYNLKNTDILNWVPTDNLLPGLHQAILNAKHGDEYKFQMIANGNRMIEFTWIYRDPCSKYENVQLNFVDRLGSFMPFHFTMKQKHNKQIKREEYIQKVDSDYFFNPEMHFRGSKVHNIEVTETYELTTDWLNQADVDAFMELVESPEVYWFDKESSHYAVTIKDTNVEYKKTTNGDLIQYTITIEMAQKNNTQHG